MHPIEFFWRQSDIFFVHLALLMGAIFEIALSLANLPACPFATCILGVVVGFVSLLVGLGLWLSGMAAVTGPHFTLSRTYMFRASLAAFLMACLWFFCSVVNSFYFNEACLGSVCATVLSSQVATWMVVACWVSTLVWVFLMLYSVWRASRDKPEPGDTEMAHLHGNGEGFDPTAAMERRLIIRSGYLQVRKVPLESNKLPLLWVRRYVVLAEGHIASYSSSDNMVAGKGEAIELFAGARVVETSSSFQPIAGSWGLEVPGQERLEFAILETAEMELPNYSQDVAPEAVDRRSEWVLAMTVSIPTCVFGVPLGLAVARSGGDVPTPITVCVSWLSMHGLDEQGLYRVPGSKADVDSLVAMFDRGQVVTIPEQFFSGNVASVLVQFLKRLPSSIFTEQLEPLFERAADEGNVSMLRLLLSKLPRPHFCTLRAIIVHLTQVATYSNINEMDAANLSMCVFSRMAKTAQVLILNCDVVFNQQTPTLPCECASAHRTTCALFPHRKRSVLERRLTNARSSRASRASQASEEQVHLEARLREVRESNARIRVVLEEQELQEQFEAERRAQQAEFQRTEAQVRGLIERMRREQAQQAAQG